MSTISRTAPSRITCRWWGNRSGFTCTSRYGRASVFTGGGIGRATMPPPGAGTPGAGPASVSVRGGPRGGIAATASRSRAISAFAMFTSARRPAICASRCAIRAISTEGSEPTPAASWMADGEPTDAAIATTGGRTTCAH